MFGLPVLLVLLLAIAALWLARKKKVPYRAGLFGAMRQTLPTALAVLAVVWIAATAVAVREGGLYATHMARAWEVGELQMLKEIGSRK